ncbi:hypothetical protein ACOMHN_051427 [Nucella lapillus]
MQLKELHRTGQPGKPRIDTRRMSQKELVEQFAVTFKIELDVSQPGESATKECEELRDIIHGTTLATFRKKTSKSHDWFEAKSREASRCCQWRRQIRDSGPKITRHFMAQRAAWEAMLHSLWCLRSRLFPFDWQEQVDGARKVTPLANRGWRVPSAAHDTPEDTRQGTVSCSFKRRFPRFPTTGTTSLNTQQA